MGLWGDSVRVTGLGDLPWGWYPFLAHGGVTCPDMLGWLTGLSDLSLQGWMTFPGMIFLSSTGWDDLSWGWYPFLSQGEMTCPGDDIPFYHRVRWPVLGMISLSSTGWDDLSWGQLLVGCEHSSLVFIIWSDVGVVDCVHLDDQMME